VTTTVTVDNPDDPTVTTTSTVTSNVSAASASNPSVVHAPNTGADVPLGAVGALLASGLGFLVLGARRRRIDKTDK
jgi:LPXTG-motif cell wall-anchored protein